jgi:DNA polymerase (family 10)
MDSRTAARALSQIAAYLELTGANRFKARAYQSAARNVMALGSDDLRPMLRSGELAEVRGLGKATLAVLQDLAETGESRYLEELKAQLPEGLLELMRVPGLSTEKIHRLHAELGVASIEDLEREAASGGLRKLKGMGPKSVAKILEGIAFVRTAGTRKILPHARTEAAGLLGAVRAHPDVTRAELAGPIRRGVEIVECVDIVAACARDPRGVAQSFTRIPGVRSATGEGAEVSVLFVDGGRLDLRCVKPDEFVVAQWRATGSAEHVGAVLARLEKRKARLESLREESAIYESAGLQWVPPEMREGLGEVEAAAGGALPTLIEPGDIRGCLHCHSTWSDGTASIADMAAAARALGWSYLGISDHSEAAFYASGVTRDRLAEQHEEIDALNAKSKDFRILKGVEADILADGRVDYDSDILDRFDYVIASIHGRFKMGRDAMTARVLRALDDPHVTILAHPTGRLLLSREPYEIDIDAVLAKCAEVGVAVELNADPKRLDLDWRYFQRARELGLTVEIGPDAHSRAGLQWMDLGVTMARKGWVQAAQVLNARDAADVVAFARRRRS